VSQGKFKFIRAWLREHVHQWGKIYHTDELAKRITGSPLSEKAYCRYLKDKYQALYKF
jgi:carboxypeptidase Taq